MRTAPVRLTKVVHAVLGASSSKRWSTCTASPNASKGLPNTTNPASRWGTACHLLSDTCLKSGEEPVTYLDWAVGFPAGELAEVLYDPMFDGGEFEHVVEIDEEQVECATTFVQFCRDLYNSFDFGFMHSEVSVPIEHITGEKGATGYLDLMIGNAKMHDSAIRELVVVDLKGGMGVKVDAFETVTSFDPIFGTDVSEQKINTQIAMYLSGALAHYDPNSNIYTHVRGIIVQPRLNHISEFVCTVAELQQTIDWLSQRAEETRTNPQFVPSFEACMFCRAKDNCEARDRAVIRDVTGGFDDITIGPAEVPLASVGVMYEHLPMIEDWCVGVRRKVMNELVAGRQVVGGKGSYRLAPGQQGDRMWADEAAVAARLQTTIGEQAYKKKLVGPATVEKLTKGKTPVVTKAEWAELATLIKRAPASQPRVVLSTDPSPTAENALDGFEESPTTAEFGFNSER